VDRGLRLSAGGAFRPRGAGRAFLCGVSFGLRVILRVRRTDPLGFHLRILIARLRRVGRVIRFLRTTVGTIRRLRSRLAFLRRVFLGFGLSLAPCAPGCPLLGFEPFSGGSIDRCFHPLPVSDCWNLSAPPNQAGRSSVPGYRSLFDASGPSRFRPMSAAWIGGIGGAILLSGGGIRRFLLRLTGPVSLCWVARGGILRVGLAGLAPLRHCCF